MERSRGHGNLSKGKMELNMKTTIRLLAIFALILVTVGQPSTALAGNADKALYVHSSFETVDPSGCIVTRTNVELQDIYEPAVWIGIWKDDNCAGVRLIDATGYTNLERSEFEVAGNLDSAAVNTKVTLYDRVSQSAFDVYVDVTWTATTPMIRYVGKNLERGPSYDSGMCHWIESQIYHKRDAQASGTISDGQTDFTPQPSVNAEIFLDRYKVVSFCGPMLEATLRAQIPTATRDLQSLKYSGTEAYFYQTDSSGCIDTYVSIGAGRFLVNSGDKLSGAALFMYKYDGCNQTTILNASNDFVPLTRSDFKISGNSATLNKTITVYDTVQDKSIDVLVKLNWTTSGPSYQNVFNFQWHAPDCDEHGHEVYGWREAQLSGKILSSEVVFDPAQADYADFYWDRYIVDWCG
jgi:hypothetical protein